MNPSAVPADVLQQYGSDADITPKTAPVSPLTRRLGKWHLMLLHFPIALTAAAALAELIFLFGGKADYRTASRFLNALAALSAVGTATTGWFAAQSALAASRPVPLLSLHRNLGLCTMTLLVIVAILMETGILKGSKGQWIYRLGLLTVFLLVSWTGYEGGLMVFGED